MRLPFLISPSITGKKHFYDRIVEDLRQGKPVEMYSNSFRSSLGFDQAAELIIRLMESKNEHSIVNVCGDRDLSKYDVGVLIAKREKLDPGRIVPVLAEQSAEWSSVCRAHSTLMDNSLMKKTIGLREVELFERLS